MDKTFFPAVSKEIYDKQEMYELEANLVAHRLNENGFNRLHELYDKLNVPKNKRLYAA